MSSRVKCWRIHCNDQKELPYHAFGRALAQGQYAQRFYLKLKCYDHMLQDPPVVSQDCPATVENISKLLGFSRPAWTVSLALNDVALTLGERYVFFDKAYEKAQLSAGGVSFHGEHFSWQNVTEFNRRFNVCSGDEVSRTTIRMTETCHVICECRQFYGCAWRMDQTPFNDNSTEKLRLCDQLAQWCLQTQSEPLPRSSSRRRIFMS